MRLRSRATTRALQSSQHSHSNGDISIDTSSSSSSSSSGRAILGDVSNKRHPTARQGKNGGKAGGKKAKGGFKSSASSAACPEEQGSENAITQDRNDGSREVTKATNVAEQKRGTRRLVTKSSSSSGRATRASSRGNNKGGKRTGDDISEGEGRKLKKAKVSSTQETKRKTVLNENAGQKGASRVRSRARARAQDHYVAQHDTVDESASDERQEEAEPTDVRNKFLVHPEFRLERATYDGTNHTLGIAAHDLENKDDVFQVAPYVTDMFQHLYSAETKSYPKMYMNEQKDINAKMRAILVDWLVEVHMKFRLVPETLYLCVNIIDRYCNLVTVARSKLQLVGVTALLIACKYEEIYPPEVRDCVYITDRAYQRQEVLDMEHDMLQRLRFKITVPTAYPFLLRFLSMTKASPLTRFAAHYYMERTLQEHDLLYYRPSFVSASAVILALNNPDIALKENDRARECMGMPKILLEYTGFKEADLLQCAALIAKKVEEEPVTASRRQLVAVKRKYDNRKFRHVSTTVEQPNVNDIIASANVGGRE